jgi:hypothetical protein
MRCAYCALRVDGGLYPLGWASNISDDGAEFAERRWASLRSTHSSSGYTFAGRVHAQPPIRAKQGSRQALIFVTRASETSKFA